MGARLARFARMSSSEPQNILPLRGEIDLNVSPELAITFSDLARARLPRVVVDLTDVTYIDSSGLAVLIVGMQQVKEYGGKFALVGLQNDVRSILETAQLDQVFATYPHIDAALAAD
jgi:anti-sigma B factor antagonist